MLRSRRAMVKAESFLVCETAVSPLSFCCQSPVLSSLMASGGVSCADQNFLLNRLIAYACYDVDWTDATGTSTPGTGDASSSVSRVSRVVVASAHAPTTGMGLGWAWACGCGRCVGSGQRGGG